MSISIIHAVNAQDTPEEAMLRLGKEYNEIMAARFKALNKGLTVIHEELCKLSRTNESAQAELLKAHPELMALSLNAEVR